MIKKTSILTVSVIAVMAVCSARADIASTTYVDTQVQSVDNKLTAHTGNNDIHVTSAEKSAWNAKQDVGNMVTATTGADYTGNKDSTTKYPSMATVQQMVTDGTNGLAGSFMGKQDKSSANYQMGNSSGSWTTMTPAQQNALNSGATSALVGKITTNETAIAAINNAETGAVATAKAYTDSQISDVAGDVSSLNSTVSGHTAELSQVTSDISTLNSGKQEKSTADYQVGKSGGGWTTLSAGQIAAINSGATSGLIGKISTNETAINTLNGTGAGSVANSIASALTSYSTTAQMNTELAKKADKSTIGTVPEGSTVMAEIAKAQTAATYDDTALAGRVTANETAIGTINNSNVMKSGIDSTKVAQIATNASNITALQSGKQDTLVTDGANANLAGAGSVSVDKDANGKITITGTTTDISGKADKANITGATKTKITYNNQGIVTAGADLAESDIPTLSISKTDGLQAALDGKQAAGNYITVPAATGTSGKSVLTYDAATTTYYWEEIGR
jgi:uncharacterized protein YaiI (UPF0178 family)